MSWEALAWAVRKGKDYQLEPITRYVMVTMANYADKEGNDIYPSLGTLVQDTGLEERTIRRHIKKLIDVKLLDYGDQSIVQNNPKFRNDRLPKVYRFLFHPPATGHTVQPLLSHDRTLSPRRPDSRPGTKSTNPLNRKDNPARAAAGDLVPMVCTGCDRLRPARLLTSSGLCPDCIAVGSPEQLAAAEAGLRFRLEVQNRRRAAKGLPPLDSLEDHG